MNRPKLKRVIDWYDKYFRRIFPVYKFLGFMGLILFWLILTFIISYLALLIFKPTNSTTSLSDVVLLITAAFIIFYTYETYKMRQQSRQSMEAEFLPIVVFSYDDNPPYIIWSDKPELLEKNGFNFYLTNVGRGIAKEMEVYIEGYKISLHRSLEVNSEPHNFYFSGKELPEELLKIFIRSKPKINVRIEYKDVFENVFCTETTFDFCKRNVNGSDKPTYTISKNWDFFQLLS